MDGGTYIFLLDVRLDTTQSIGSGSKGGVVICDGRESRSVSVMSPLRGEKRVLINEKREKS